eukprot:m.193838 g.193838  ORF g.193838 m.193838 type:complete len:89 (+) comp18642_c0_seq7:381-647(+)
MSLFSAAQCQRIVLIHTFTCLLDNTHASFSSDLLSPGRKDISSLSQNPEVMFAENFMLAPIVNEYSSRCMECKSIPAGWECPVSISLA